MTERTPGDYQKYASAHEHDIVLNEHRKDEILGGRYRVLSLLGRGGMGVVYRVEQIFLGKELALKTIDQTAQSDIAIRRFQAEARAVFAVNHPNIVAVHDFGLLDDQTPFLAMELVQGRTIGEIIQTRNLSVDQILKVFIQVCHGLAHAHKCGVVHRDIKPNNIMVLDGMPIGTEGSIKILDFGIAKLTQHEGGELQALTRTGEIFGSPIYMSPEQCSGGTIDYRSDIYSFGCVLFEALTGTPPFVGESALSTMMMHQTGAIPTLKEASLGTSFAPELEQIVGAMLAKKPNERYQDLNVAADDLASVNSGQSTTINVPSSPIVLSARRNISTISLKRSHYALWIVATATMSTFVTILSMQIWFLNQSKPSEPTVKVPSLTENQLKQVIQNPPKDPKEAHVVFDKKVAQNENSFTARIVSDQDFEAFRNYKGAQIIEARDLSEHDLTNTGLSYLKNSKVLQLSLRGDLQGLDNFTQLKHINILVLSKSFLSDGALSNIAKLKMLSILNLENVRNVTENQIRELTHSNSLKTLILTQGVYSPGLIKELHEKIPRCIIMNYDFEDEKESARHPSLDEQFKMISGQLEKARAANPNSSGVALYLQQLGNIRMTQHRSSESLALLEKGIQLLEKNGDDNALPSLLEGAASAAGEMKNLPLSIKYSDRLVDLVPAAMLHNETDM